MLTSTSCANSVRKTNEMQSDGLRGRMPFMFGSSLSQRTFVTRLQSRIQAQQ